MILFLQYLLVEIWTYKQGTIIRKKDIQKDIVLPLTREFDKSQEMNLAKTILEEVRSTDYGFYN